MSCDRPSANTRPALITDPLWMTYPVRSYPTSYCPIPFSVITSLIFDKIADILLSADRISSLRRQGCSHGSSFPYMLVHRNVRVYVRMQYALEFCCRRIARRGPGMGNSTPFPASLSSEAVCTPPHERTRCERSCRYLLIEIPMDSARSGSRAVKKRNIKSDTFESRVADNSGGLAEIAQRRGTAGRIPLHKNYHNK